MKRPSDVNYVPVILALSLGDSPHLEGIGAEGSGGE
jgi:hypothetical protein